jgi:multiple sugar transport system ATP-binding protein
MADVRFERATHFYPGAERPAVDGLDLDIGDGEFIVLVGPSGCGKSTCLRMLAGLEEVHSGAIWVGDRDVTRLEPKDRDVAMVFQNYALYPHMSVADNMGFALKMAGEPKDEVRERVTRAAQMLDIEQLLDRMPSALSGGQRQRVAMGRAIVRQPKVFLLDEPLSNLDAKLRASTRVQHAGLQRRLGITTVYVTHDQVEAMTLGDRVAVLKGGVLQQVGAPWDLYDQPTNVFVAGFMGSPAMNLINVNLATDGLSLFGPPEQVLRCGSAAVPRDCAAVTVGLRPEDMELVGEGLGLRTTVHLVEDVGPNAYLHGSAAVDGHDLPITARLTGRRPLKGDTVYLAARPGRMYLFSASDGSRLAREDRAVPRVA